MTESQLRARKEFCFQSSEHDWIVVAYAIRGACIQLFDRQSLRIISAAQVITRMPNADRALLTASLTPRFGVQARRMP